MSWSLLAVAFPFVHRPAGSQSKAMNITLLTSVHSSSAVLKSNLSRAAWALSSSADISKAILLLDSLPNSEAFDLFDIRDQTI